MRRDVTEQELWEWMMEAKQKHKFRRAHATLSRDIVMSKWQGHGADPEFIDVPVKAGTRVNVVMASRFGDVGITDDLNAEHGYHYRTQCVDSGFDGRAANLLIDITPVGEGGGE